MWDCPKCGCMNILDLARCPQCQAPRPTEEDVPVAQESDNGPKTEPLAEDTEDSEPQAPGSGNGKGGV